MTGTREPWRALDMEKAPLQVLPNFAPVVSEIEQEPDALLVIPAPTFVPLQRRIAELAVANRLPSIGDDLMYARAGLLLSYGVSYADLERRAATYADKILKGANPADLPVEKP